MGNGNVRLPTELTPLNRSPKIVTDYYLGDPYSCAKFGAHRPRGLLDEWVKYNQHFQLTPCFGNSPTVQTRRLIFTRDGSDDADSCTDVPFCVSLTWFPI